MNKKYTAILVVLFVLAMERIVHDRMLTPASAVTPEVAPPSSTSTHVVNDFNKPLQTGELDPVGWWKNVPQTIDAAPATQPIESETIDPGTSQSDWKWIEVTLNKWDVPVPISGTQRSSQGVSMPVAYDVSRAPHRNADSLVWLDDGQIGNSGVAWPSFSSSAAPASHVISSPASHDQVTPTPVISPPLDLIDPSLPPVPQPPVTTTPAPVPEPASVIVPLLMLTLVSRRAARLR